MKITLHSRPNKNYPVGNWVIPLLLLLFPLKAIGSNWIDLADISWYTGNESKTEFTISTAEQLSGLAKLVNSGNTFAGKTVLLDKDIHLANKFWTPIGYNQFSQLDNPITFNGTFDGRNHVISGLTIQTSGTVALFGVTRNSKIKNVKISGQVTLKETNFDSDNFYASGLISMNYGKVFNCQTNIRIEGVKYTYIGGIAGLNSGTIQHCSNTGELKNHTEGAIGGIAGYNNGTIENCMNAGLIDNHKGAAGGIACINDCGTILLCYNTANITASQSTGGITAITHSYLRDKSSLISRCYNTGNIICSGTLEAGGIGGEAYRNPVDPETTISDCYNIGTVTSTNKAGYWADQNGYAGGIIGVATNINIFNCYNRGFVTGNYLVGSITAAAWGDMKVICFFETGTAEMGIGTQGLGDIQTLSMTKTEMKSDNFLTKLGRIYWNRDPAIQNGYPYLLNVGPANNPVDPDTLGTSNMKIKEPADIHISAIDSRLHIESARAATIRIIHLRGSVFRTFRIPAGSHELSLPTGIYLVNVKGEKTQKVSIK